MASRSRRKTFSTNSRRDKPLKTGLRVGRLANSKIQKAQTPLGNSVLHGLIVTCARCTRGPMVLKKSTLLAQPVPEGDRKCLPRSPRSPKARLSRVNISTHGRARARSHFFTSIDPLWDHSQGRLRRRRIAGSVQCPTTIWNLQLSPSDADEFAAKRA
jgi:hypothetical protein